MSRWVGASVVALGAVGGCLLSDGTTLYEPTLTPDLVRSTSARVNRMPLAFEQNIGQTSPEVKYLARGNGFTAFLTSRETVFSLRREMPVSNSDPGGVRARPARRQVVRMRLAGSTAAGSVTAGGKLPGVSNYFLGRSEPVRRAPQYERVRMAGVYPGIDVEFYGQQRQLEFDFRVAPGADPGDVRLSFEGAEGLRLTEAGEAQVLTETGPLTLQAPVLYQEGAKGREAIQGRFEVLNNRELGFRVAAYDVTRELVIDPVLLWGSYLGGSGLDQGRGIAIDEDLNVYVAGWTDSVDFPVTAGVFAPAKSALTDAYVTKIGSEGDEIIWSSYLGGSGQDYGYAVGVDPAGRVYVAGSTSSRDFPLASPLEADVHQPEYGGGASDGFVTRFTADGSALHYSTYLGGSIPRKPGADIGEEVIYGMSVDLSGNAYLAGSTTSDWFPTRRGLVEDLVGPPPGGAPSRRLPYMGNTDAFLTKLNVVGELDFSTYLGGGRGNYTGNTDYGAGVDIAYGIDVDPDGNMYVCGSTSSKNFPVANNLQRVNRSIRSTDNDCWIAKIRAGGQEFPEVFFWSTYLGGHGNDVALAIAADVAGNAYVTGFTRSYNFPASKKEPPAWRATAIGGDDAFVSKIDANGFRLVYSTYLGGTDNDQGRGIAVDSNGITYITGSTTSVNFPVTRALQAHFGGLYDAFVTKLDSYGNQLLYSAYFGSNDQDFGHGIVVDGKGDTYIVGTTLGGTFPSTAGSFQPAYGGGTSDAFVAKVSDERAIGASGSIRAPRRLTFPRVPTGVTITKRITIKNVARTPLAISVGALQAPFRVGDNGGNIVMPPRSYINITINFRPDSQGRVTRTLQISSSDPRRPVVEVVMAGTGYVP